MDQRRAAAVEGAAVRSAVVMHAVAGSFADTSALGVLNWDRLCQCARVDGTCSRHQGVVLG